MDEQTLELMKDLAARVDEAVASSVMVERGIEYNQDNWDAFWDAAPDASDAFWDGLIAARESIVGVVFGDERYNEFTKIEFDE